MSKKKEIFLILYFDCSQTTVIETANMTYCRKRVKYFCVFFHDIMVKKKSKRKRGDKRRQKEEKKERRKFSMYTHN